MKQFKLILSLLALFLFGLTGYSQNTPKFAELKMSLSDFRQSSGFFARYGLIRFSPDTKFLAVSGKAADIIIYDIENGKIQAKIDGSGFSAFSFLPDGKSVILEESGHEYFKIFDYRTGQLLKTIDNTKGISGFRRMTDAPNTLEMMSVTVTPDWKTLLVMRNTKEFQLTNLETGEKQFDIVHEKGYSSTWELGKLIFAPTLSVLFQQNGGKFSPDGRFLVITSGNRRPTLWNVKTGAKIGELTPQDSFTNYANFSPDSKYAITYTTSGIIGIWDSATGKLISIIGNKQNRYIAYGGWIPNSQLIVVQRNKKDAEVFDALTGKLKFTMLKSDSAGAIPSKNGKYIFTVPRKDETKLFELWNAENGEFIASFPRVKADSPMTSLDWSPDGNFIMTASKKDVRIWNMKGELIQELENSQSPARFSDDGKYIVTGSNKDTGLLWEIK
ncbi:MAG: WD40 repeat domain-containing protein [Acidobacteriota bacterium]